MSFMDRFRKRGKGSSPGSESSEDSFDLDDDALFATDEGDSGAGDDGFGSLAALDEDDSGAAFESMGSGADDPGAAATADFDDLSGSLGGDSLAAGGMGDDDFGGGFGDDALGFDDEPAEAEAGDTKKKKGRKAKKARVSRGAAPGRGKVVGIMVAVAVVGLGAGAIGGPILKAIATGEGKLRAEIEADTLKLQQMKQQLVPLKRAASPEEVQVMQTEMHTRREQETTMDAITAKVADLADRRDERDHALARRDAAATEMEVRQASLLNVEKQVQQVEARVNYLSAQSARFAVGTTAYDNQVRAFQKTLPPEYKKAATVEATRTLSIHARPSASAPQ